MDLLQTRVIIDISTLLGSIDHIDSHANSIFLVSDQLREPKEEAFRPKIISVGPLHRGAVSHLQFMDEYKWRYTLSFLQRPESSDKADRTEDDPSIRLRNCVEDIVRLDQVIRASYAGQLQLDCYELAKLMIVDGCFVLELLLRLCEYTEQREVNDNHVIDDPIFYNKDKLLFILNDLTLLENQVPLLKKLYRKVFPIQIGIAEDHRVADLFLKAFNYPPLQNPGTAHLLHLIHLSNVDQEMDKARLAFPELKRCATRLQASGITIQPANSNKFLVRPIFGDIFDCDMSFNNGVLKIPPLLIKETTEVTWRNLIAWEQSRMGTRCRFSSYALFFKSLICCKHDIRLLEERGVIVNGSTKSKEELLRLFRTIPRGVELMDHSYKELF